MKERKAFTVRTVRYLGYTVTRQRCLKHFALTASRSFELKPKTQSAAAALQMLLDEICQRDCLHQEDAECVESIGKHWKALESIGKHWKALESIGKHRDCQGHPNAVGVLLSEWCWSLPASITSHGSTWRINSIPIGSQISLCEGLWPCLETPDTVHSSHPLFTIYKIDLIGTFTISSSLVGTFELFLGFGQMRRAFIFHKSSWLRSEVKNEAPLGLGPKSFSQASLGTPISPSATRFKLF